MGTSHLVACTVALSALLIARPAAADVRWPVLRLDAGLEYSRGSLAGTGQPPYPGSGGGAFGRGEAAYPLLRGVPVDGYLLAGVGVGTQGGPAITDPSASASDSGMAFWYRLGLGLRARHQRFGLHGGYETGLDTRRNRVGFGSSTYLHAWVAGVGYLGDRVEGEATVGTGGGGAGDLRLLRVDAAYRLGSGHRWVAVRVDAMPGDVENQYTFAVALRWQP